MWADKRTRDKVTICGNNYLKYLTEYIDLNNIPIKYNGKSKEKILYNNHVLDLDI